MALIAMNASLCFMDPSGLILPYLFWINYNFLKSFLSGLQPPIESRSCPGFNRLIQRQIWDYFILA
jgi:hypothetical protein